MKKIIGILSLILTAIVLFTACGADTAEKPATTAPAPAAPAATAQAEPPTELNMMMMTSPQADVALVEDALNKILIPKINVKLKITEVASGAYVQQQNLVLSSNEKVDLLLTFPNTYLNMVAQNKIQEIGPLLDKYGQGVKEALGKFLQGSMVNGKIYGVRPFTDLAGGGGFVIRKDIVDKYQLDLSGIKKLEDFTRVMKAIKDKEPDAPIMTYSNATLGWLEYEMQWIVTKLVDYFGVIMPEDEDALKVSNIFETQFYADRLKLVRDWYKKGYFIKDVSTATEDKTVIVKANRAYAYMSPTKPGLEVQESSACAMPMVVVEYSEPRSATSNITIWQWVVPNGCEHPEKAVQLLNEMYTNSDVVNLLAYGIEGKHYEKKADGTIGFLPGKNSNNSGYFKSPWMMGNGFLSYVWEGSNPDLWKQMKQYNESAKISKAMGFSYDPTPIKAEVAALTSAYGQYKRGLESGSVDPDKVLPEMLSKLKASGLDKVIAEKQNQLDAWAKSNNIK